MKLWNKYKVTSIPSLVFVDAATGKVVCRNGLLVVRDDPKGEMGRPHALTRSWFVISEDMTMIYF